MNNRRRQFPWATSYAIVAVASLLPVDRAVAGPVASFDDISFWVGEGDNRAAEAIEWSEGATARTTLVWGFRWDGVATGQTMLSAVVAADPRLFAKSGGFSGLGASLYGLGYDDGDDEFALDDDTTFDEFGFAAVDGPADGAQAIDAEDYYNEGWFLGFWNYGYSDGNPFAGGQWKPSQVGMGGRALQDGDWDSWAFHAPANQAAFQEFADAPFAAEPPVSDDNADFNGDGIVDGSDFLTWQRGFGTLDGAELEQGDANGDGLVDGADLNAWSAAFGVGAAPPNVSSLATAVPEPATVGLGVAAALFIVAIARCRNLQNGIAAWK
jgi:hypothetical protein